MNYYDLMLSPTITRTEFYKTSRERFLIVIASMLQYNPIKRPTFIEALREWDGTNILLKPNDDAVYDADDDHATTAPFPPAPSPSLPLPRHSRGCLVLTERRLSAGRNKTRRSPRSSGRCRSIDNRAIKNSLITLYAILASGLQSPVRHLHLPHHQRNLNQPFLML